MAVTMLLRAVGLPRGVDRTLPADYHMDAGDPQVDPIRELTR
ncbi:hypothetical protein [Acrocarpospora pleiomorpha]|nr:hypothetical protein [Acrocarpospora pleiomorpha]